MPIYEYRCKECGEHFEKRQSIGDDPLKTCEKCGGDVEKQWSLSGFQFKGAGWYVTDYSAKNSGKGKAETAEKSSEKSSGGQSTDTGGAASKSNSETTPSSKSDSDSKKG